MTELSKKSTVAIVGGGVLGMYLAWRLAERGYCTTIYESAPATGGLASAMSIGETTWDRFYHVILMSDRHLVDMLQKLDLESELEWGITKTGFYTDGELVSMSNALEFLKFPPLNLIDKFRLGATIFYASRIRNWQSLESVLAIDWLKKLSGRRVFEKIWLPLLKSKLGDNYEIASAAFIWAIIARMYAARRAGLKQEMFGYVRGGYATILEGMRRRLSELDVTIVHDAKVDEIRSDTDKATVLVGENESRFDHVVLTVPTDAAAGMCPELAPAEVERLNGVEYQGIICPSFLLKREISRFYVTNITDSGVPFTGVIEMTALVDPANFDGNALVYLPQYLTQSSTYWEKSDEEIYDDCLTGLEKMYPTFQRSDVVAMNIARARKVLAISTLNYSQEHRPELATSIPIVSLLNSAQIANGTLNVNETIGVVNENFDALIARIEEGELSHG